MSAVRTWEVARIEKHRLFSQSIWVSLPLLIMVREKADWCCSTGGKGRKAGRQAVPCPYGEDTHLV